MSAVLTGVPEEDLHEPKALLTRHVSHVRMCSSCMLYLQLIEQDGAAHH